MNPTHKILKRSFPGMSKSYLVARLCTIAAGESIAVSNATTDISKQIKEYTDAYIPRAPIINGRYTSPWDEITRKGLVNIFHGLIWREKEEKIISPKYSLNHHAIGRWNEKSLVDRLRDRRGMHFSWLGHSTCYVQMGGCYIITDPVWCHRVSPIEFIGPARYMSPLLEIEALPAIDIVVLSHSHYDHLDLSSARRIGNKAIWLVPAGLKSLMESEGITNCVELNWWQTYTHLSKDGAMIDITFTPAQHWTGRTLFDRNSSLWGSYAIKSTDGSFFFGGDTAANPFFKLVGDLLGPFDIAAIPIGAYKPRNFTKHVHCDPVEALQIHKDIRAKQSVGIHWGTYPLTNEDVIEPPLELARARDAAQILCSEFFTASLGEVISPGDDPKEDFAILNPDLYRLYIDQVWQRQCNQRISPRER